MADAGHRSTGKARLERYVAKRNFKKTAEPSHKASTVRGKKGFQGVLPRRWAVERTFSWLGQSRRLSKEYEHLCETSEALIYATMSRLMARRLARI